MLAWWEFRPLSHVQVPLPAGSEAMECVFVWRAQPQTDMAAASFSPHFLTLNLCPHLEKKHMSGIVLHYFQRRDCKAVGSGESPKPMSTSKLRPAPVEF